MRISDWSSDVCSSDLRLLGAQLEHLRDDAGVVVLVAAAVAAHRSLVDALAQGAVGQLRQRRLAGGVEQGDDVLAVQPALLGLGGGGGDLLVGQPVKLGLVVDHHGRSEEHTSELQSLMRISYAVFCLKKKKKQNTI